MVEILIGNEWKEFKGAICEKVGEREYVIKINEDFIAPKNINDNEVRIDGKLSRQVLCDDIGTTFDVRHKTKKSEVALTVLV